jgi:hypothetical protein
MVIGRLPSRFGPWPCDLIVNCLLRICVNQQLARHSLARRLVHLRLICLPFRCPPRRRPCEGGSIRVPYSGPFVVPIRGSELKPNRSLVGSVRDYRFELPLIRTWMDLYQAQMIDVRLGGNPLHIVRLDVFN